MKRTAPWAALLALAGTAACSDLPLQPRESTPRAAAPRAPSGNTLLSPQAEAARIAYANVTSSAYGATANDTTDDAEEIQRAVNSAREVHIPAGTYHIDRAILLPSNTRIHGTGTLVVKPGSGAHAFLARGSATEHVQDLSVDSLTFVGDSTRGQSALWVETAKRVKFRHNTVRHMAMFVSDVIENSIQDKRMRYAAISEPRLSSEMVVEGNKGVGPSGGEPGGIKLVYTRGVTVHGNEVRRYSQGIMWHGGDANPDSLGGDGRIGNTRWARNITITQNIVHTIGDWSIGVGRTTDDVGGGPGPGIWGSMGDTVDVRNNTVSNCMDTCLDAEGTYNVTFVGNTATNSTLNGVAAVFHYSKNVTFAWNHLIQDGTHGDKLFSTNNQSLLGMGINIAVHNNTFEYTGNNPGRIGVVMKDASDSFLLNNNTFKNVVVRLRGCWPNGQCQNNGYVEVNGNGFHFTREITGSAVEVGHNWHTTAWVAGNVISSDVFQFLPAIWGVQNGDHGVTMRIFDNQIYGFYPGIRVESSSGVPQTFHLQGNTSVHPCQTQFSGASHNVLLNGNTWGNFCI